MNIKRTLVVGATVATVAAGGLGSVGLVSAATAGNSGTASALSTADNNTSLVDKIAARFNLNKADVQAVFDQDRQEHEAQRDADQKQKLADAVTSGKLTQAQADHITSVMNEIKSLQGAGDPRNVNETVHDQIKSKMDALHQWADDNNVDMRYVMGKGGHGDFGPRGDGQKPDDGQSVRGTSH